jgi:hypothetical protein
VHDPALVHMKPVAQVPHELTQPDADGPHTRPLQSLIGTCVHTPEVLQVSTVQATPSEHAVLPQLKQPDGDKPQSRPRQSFAKGGCVHVTPEQTSSVQGFPSVAHKVPLGAATQRLPSQV